MWAVVEIVSPFPKRTFQHISLWKTKSINNDCCFVSQNILTSLNVWFFRSFVRHCWVCTPWKSSAVLKREKTFWVSTQQTKFLWAFSHYQGLCVFRVPDIKRNGIPGNKKGMVALWHSQTRKLRTLLFTSQRRNYFHNPFWTILKKIAL